MLGFEAVHPNIIDAKEFTTLTIPVAKAPCYSLCNAALILSWLITKPDANPDPAPTIAPEMIPAPLINNIYIYIYIYLRHILLPIVDEVTDAATVAANPERAFFF